MPNINAPFYPIIYVRGYAMTQDEQDETTADPFCGFNLGSTVYRAAINKSLPAQKYIFESPLVRLNTDFGYQHVYKNGLDIVDGDWQGAISIKSVVIYRYYEQASALLGSASTPAMEDFAKGLSDLILKVRDLVCLEPANNVSAADFKCYLVAHSMGGLVCRAFLQNPALGSDDARDCVAKLFTYATPHNGIDMAGINVPSWLGAGDMNNFNRDRMADYLGLKNTEIYKKTQRVDWWPYGNKLSSRDIFCLIGTNRDDYQVAMGASRTFAGHGSDGLVRIENAAVWGVEADGITPAPCATAFVYRSHSGYFGIVNGEESYQNLTRFLFGNLRVDVWVDIADARLPDAIKDDAVEASYLFEVLASPKGKRWSLTRRELNEDSVACCNQSDLTGISLASPKKVYLSSVFLSKAARVDPKNPSLTYLLDLGIRVQDYQIDKKFWVDGHYEGGYLFRDSLFVSVTPPAAGQNAWTAIFSWQSQNPGGAGNASVQAAVINNPDGTVEMSVPFSSIGNPGIAGHLRFEITNWN